MQKYTFRKWQKLREEDHLTYVWKTVFFLLKILMYVIQWTLQYIAMSTEVTIQLPNIDIISWKEDLKN